MKKKKVLSLVMTLAVGASILAGCGSSSTADSSASSEATAAATSADDTASQNTTEAASDSATSSGDQKITIFQNKTEIYDQMVAMAKDYEAETGVAVDVWQISGDDYYQNLKTYLSSESGPTIFTVESDTEIAELKDYMSPLTDLSFIDKENDSLLAKNDDGTVIGIPTTAEGFGLVYNQDLYDPSKISSIDDLVSYIETEKDSGVEGVGLSQEAYFLIGHILNTPFALQDDPDAFCQKVYDGEVNIADVDEFQQLGKLFEAIRANETNPLEVTYDTNVGNFATGKTATIHQGNWCYSMFADYDVSFDMGIAALPIDGNDKIAVSRPAVWAVNSDATEEEQQLGKDFLNWLYTSETGTDYLMNKFGFVPVIEGMTADNLDPLSQTVSDAITSGNILPWTFNTSWPAGIVTTYLAPTTEEFFSNPDMTADDYLRALNDNFVQAASE